MASARITSCAAGLLAASTLTAGVTVDNYGTMPDGRPVHSYELVNASGVRAVVLEYGATLQSVETPDRTGRIADITLGYDTLAGWLGNKSYFGATVGRYANRIAGGRFVLDGKEYSLATNNSPGGIPCHLHGGNVGFDKRLWSGRVVKRNGTWTVELKLRSPAGEEGYPGSLDAQVAYWLTEKDELHIEFTATSDAATPVNLTNHTYWNLSANPTTPILDHELTLKARRILPVNKGLIPLGSAIPVKGTPFDFTRPKKIGRDIAAKNEQLELGNGYDHCWAVDGTGLRQAARVHDPVSGRTLTLSTDQPGIQFYTGNFLDGSVAGKKGSHYAFRTGFCLEPGKYPDSPNHPEFPTAILRPGKTYRHTIVLKFSAE